MPQLMIGCGILLPRHPQSLACEDAAVDGHWVVWIDNLYEPGLCDSRGRPVENKPILMLLHKERML